ncbi:scavenger receptor cysteine-rich domain-containing protein DMBT1-like [Amphiura filiformis]|uniref:scavenger receptor cysteine-rich domain-containing protein DMBT1-like n=1 Tax=Amphiura filiformis TaxID=82378 RepID=UPI003B211174
MRGTSTIIAALLLLCFTLPAVEGGWMCDIFGGGWGWDDCSYNSYDYYSLSASWYYGSSGGDHQTGVKPHEAIYLGCYNDDYERALPDASTVSYSMTLETCFRFCWDNNARYAGLEHGSQCHCGKENTDYGIHGEARRDSDCSSYCYGDYTEKCGGDGKLSIYDLRNSSTANENDVRLINWERNSYYSNQWYRGMVEIYQDGKWKTICDFNWSKKEADVVCRQLGYGEADDFYIQEDEDGDVRDTGDEIDIAYSDVTCVGNEISLASCTLKAWTDKTIYDQCGSVKNVGVKCTGPEPLSKDSIRLEGGEDEYSGRVVMEYHGVEGYICDDDWDLVDAAVVCHQLDFGAPLEAVGGDVYRSYISRPLLLDNMECSASDKKYSRTLDECTHGQWNNTDCGMTQVAGVKCHPPGINDIRLADGATESEGRLEILHDGEWGTVCDKSWDIEDADVTCRMLGYPWALSTTPSGFGIPIFLESWFAYYDFGTTDKKDQEEHWYGPGTGPIHFKKVSCEGYETTIEDCLNTEDLYYTDTWTCTHNNDVGIKCADKSDTQVFPVRLVDGLKPYEGRVEVQWNGIWGTVCDDNWDINDATVVCRQLGLGDAIRVAAGSAYGTGGDEDVLILLDDVNCTGHEYYLSDCPHLGWHTHDCRHHEDAGVVCDGIHDCRHHEDAGVVCQGWHTHDCRHHEDAGVVCQGWHTHDCRHHEDAGVVCQGWHTHDCRHHEDAGVVCQGWHTHDCRHHEDAGVVCQGWHTHDCRHHEDAGVVCQGWHTHDCRHHEDAGVVCQGWHTHDCRHHEDAGVVCQGWHTHDCRHHEDAGVVCQGWHTHDCRHHEDAGVVCQGWHTHDCRHHEDAGVVCQGWHTHDCRHHEDAGVVCQGWHTHDCRHHEDAGVWSVKVNCTGHEYYLSDCPHLGWHTHDCRHHEDAGVVCQGAFDLNDIIDNIGGHGPPGGIDVDGIMDWWQGFNNDKPRPTGDPATRPPRDRGISVRLVGGTRPSEGRVELSHRGKWGTVCNHGWDVNDANVICAMLGYEGAAEDGVYRDFGAGSGTIYLSDVDCNGKERSIAQCEHADWGDNTCTHEEDAGVVCIDYDDKIAVRLVDGNSKSEGHVEVLRSGAWGAVCDSGWDIKDAKVVCRQIGYSDAKKATTGSAFGANNGPILASNVYCTGKERDLSQCTISWDASLCDSSDHAGVVCGDDDDAEKGNTDKHTGVMSAGMASGLTLIVIAVLLIVIAVLVTVMFMRRKKKATDTRPMIPPSNLSDLPIAYANSMPNHSQAIGGAIGGIAQPPPLYTPTEIVNKVPLDGGIDGATAAEDTGEPAAVDAVK